MAAGHKPAEPPFPGRPAHTTVSQGRVKLYRHCIPVSKYGVFLFIEIGAVVITDYK